MRQDITLANHEAAMSRQKTVELNQKFLNTKERLTKTEQRLDSAHKEKKHYLEQFQQMRNINRDYEDSQQFMEQQAQAPQHHPTQFPFHQPTQIPSPTAPPFDPQDFIQAMTQQLSQQISDQIDKKLQNVPGYSSSTPILTNTSQYCYSIRQNGKYCRYVHAVS